MSPANRLLLQFFLLLFPPVSAVGTQYDRQYCVERVDYG